MKDAIAAAIAACLLSSSLAGCSGPAPSNEAVGASGAGGQEASATSSGDSVGAGGDQGGSAGASSSAAGAAGPDGPRSRSWGLVPDDLIDRLAERYGELEAKAIEELEDRENAKPVHVSIGEEVDVTGNLAVTVLSVEPAEYDYADSTPTVAVAVSFRNKTDRAIWVKASNVDADTTDGRRVDHKLYVEDERGGRSIRSFLPAKVSPGATFVGTVYFDAEGLNAVVYQPHWLVSAQNQYVYWDCG